MSPGNLRNKSAIRSIGAASIPTALSNHGFSPAAGWLRDGTKALVLSNFLAKLSDEASDEPRVGRELRARSRSGRSFDSSSSIWCLSSVQISSNLGTNASSAAFRFWNSFRSTLIFPVLASSPATQAQGFHWPYDAAHDHGQPAPCLHLPGTFQRPGIRGVPQQPSDAPAAIWTGCHNDPDGLKFRVQGQHVSYAVCLRGSRTEVTLVVDNLVVVFPEIVMVTRDGLWDCGWSACRRQSATDDEPYHLRSDCSPHDKCIAGTCWEHIMMLQSVAGQRKRSATENCFQNVHTMFYSTQLVFINVTSSQQLVAIVALQSRIIIMKNNATNHCMGVHSLPTIHHWLVVQAIGGSWCWHSPEWLTSAGHPAYYLHVVIRHFTVIDQPARMKSS